MMMRMFREILVVCFLFKIRMSMDNNPSVRQDVSMSKQSFVYIGK